MTDPTLGDSLTLNLRGDSPTVSEPRTEAGRVLLKVSANQRKNTDSWADYLPERILAIEAEAAQPIDGPTVSALLMEAELNDLMGPDYDPDRLAGYLVARLSGEEG